MTGLAVPVRLKAFSIHILISTAAFLVVLYLILFHWYPKPHFVVNGGWQGIRIMLCVDFTIGPFLTLILFNKGKSQRALVFDLCVIAIVQIGAFGWGVYAVHSQRPVGLVLSSIGTIYPILEEELSLQDKTPADMQQFANGKLPLAYAREPSNDDEKAGAFMFEFVEGMSSDKLFFLFEPIKQHINDLFAASLEKIEHPPKSFLEIRKNYLAEHNLKEDEVAFVPFAGKYGYSLLIFNRSGAIIDSIPDPRYGNYPSLLF